MNWTTEQIQQISALGNLVDAFTKIKQDPDVFSLLTPEQQIKLLELENYFKDIHEKLNKQEFSVAIVGLENSGKSSLGNTLIGIPDLLPTSSLRCTFTVTKARSGEISKGEVSIYTPDEFEKKFIGDKQFIIAVKKILDLKSIPAKTLNFSTMRWTDIEKYLRYNADKVTVEYVQRKLTERQKYNRSQFGLIEQIADVIHIDEDKLSFANITKDTQEIIDANLLPQHDNDSLNDVKTILKNWDQIHELIADEANRVLSFDKSKLLTTEFKKFITGNPNDKPIDPARIEGYPYAAKEITIWSTEFKNMPNIVLYDVPGFDSTNALHKQQTIDRINEADAIILIVDLNNPEIKSSQKEVFGSGQDKYGIDYKNKVLIFANKADMLLAAANIADPADEAKKQKNALISTAEAQKISKDEYVVCGSAFLQDAELKYSLNKPVNINQQIHQNLLQVDGQQKLRTEFDVLQQLNLIETIEYTDLNGKHKEQIGGVKLLIRKLENYYRTARYDVLMGRINKLFEDANQLLAEINITYTEIEGTGIGKFYIDAWNNLDDFNAKAHQIIEEAERKLLTNKTFSNSFESSKLSDIFPNQTEDSPVLKRISETRASGTHGVIPIGTIETLFREHIFLLFLDKIYGANDIKMKCEKDGIYKSLNNAFLSSMGMSDKTNSKIKKELEAGVDELFDHLRKHKRWAANGFIDFRGDIYMLIEVLIKYPLYSTSRKDAVTDKNNFNRLCSLANYYASHNAQDSDNVKQQRFKEFFTRILLQSSNNKEQSYVTAYPLQPVDVQDQVDYLKEYFESKYWTNPADKPEIDDGLLINWTSKLVSHDRKCDKSLEQELDDCLSDMENAPPTSNDEKIARLQRTFDEYIESYPVAQTIQNTAPVAKQKITVEWLKNLDAFDKITVNDVESMIRVLNTDIQNLRLFTQEALIAALNIEGGFLSLIKQDVDSIRFAYLTEYGKTKLKMWMEEYVEKINVNAIQAQESQKRQNEHRKQAAKSIETALNNLKECI